LLNFDVLLGIFISGSCAAHKNRDEFVAFGNLRCHGAVLNQSKIKIQQSSIVNQTAVVEELGDRQIWQLWT
jgi:hypothetical protein